LKRKKKTEKKKKGKRRRDEEEEGEDDFGIISDDEEEEVTPPKKSKIDKDKELEKDLEQEFQMDAEESSSEEEFDDGYGSDLMGDEEDRRTLLNLPESKRETIIAERYEKRRELKERWELKKKLKDDKKRKRKSLDASDRQTRSKRNSKKEVSALTDYRAERAKQPTKSYDFPDTLAIEKDKDDKRLSKEDRHTDDSSEVTTKQEHPITFEDLNKIRLKRDHLEKWVHKPIFEKIVPNFFVRIGIGTKDNQRVYRVAEIIEVKDSTKKYLLGKTETTKQLVLKHGSSLKPFRMEFISNQDFSKEEYNRWEHEMSKISDPLPTLKEVAAKLESLKEIEEYTLTEADIDKVVVNKIKMRNKPINLAKEKTSLITLREAARQNDDEEEVNKLNEKNCRN